MDTVLDIIILCLCFAGGIWIMRKSNFQIIKGKPPKVVVLGDENNKTSDVKSIFMYLIPGVIAILLSLLYVWLYYTNSADPAYSSPKELSSMMSAIVGYFFGVGTEKK